MDRREITVSGWRVRLETPADRGGASLLARGFPGGHHEDHFAHLWCAAPLGMQEALVATAPDRLFVPPYVGGRGWVGMRLDGPFDQEELRTLCEDALRTVAPRKVLAQLDAGR